MNNLLKQEYINLYNSGILQKELGCTCQNCGSTENINYHHIVPLALGGTNRLTNIIPLCAPCHKAVHYGGNIKKYTHPTNKGGRPSKISDEEAFRILDQYAAGYFGHKRCAEMMNLSSRPGSVKSSSQYKKWCKERKIKNVKNTLDVNITNGVKATSDGLIIGSIEYEEKGIYPIYFQDIGMNDNVVYKLRNTNNKLTWKEIKEKE